MLALLFGLALSHGIGGCQTPERTEQTAEQSESPDPKPPVTDRQRELILGIKSPDYSIRLIGRDDKAIRVEIALVDGSVSASEARRITLNALYEVQARIGRDEHLAVWSYAGQPLTIRGMAFYSSLTDTVHFKGPEELE